MEINRQRFLTGDGEKRNKRVEMVLICKSCSTNNNAIDAFKSIWNKHNGHFDYIIKSYILIHINKTDIATEVQMLAVRSLLFCRASWTTLVYWLQSGHRRSWNLQHQETTKTQLEAWWQRTMALSFQLPSVELHYRKDAQIWSPRTFWTNQRPKSSSSKHTHHYHNIPKNNNNNKQGLCPRGVEHACN